MINRRTIPEGTSDRYREGEFNKEYSVLNELGRGRFAVVRRCEHKSTKQHFAAKFIRKRKMGRDCKDDILKEIKILEMSIDHPRMIGLHEIYESATEVILVLEFAIGGELHPYCVAERDGSFTESDVVRLLFQILEGVKHLHDQNIVHLDLKPQNILLTNEEIREGDIKLIDFGIAKWLSKDAEVREIVGTVDYVAPEVVNFEPISLATDMWSVGVVAYVMLTGISPYAGDTKQETYLNISQNNLEFPDEYFHSVSSEAQDLIKSLCVLDPGKRLTVTQCVAHPLFSDHLSKKTLRSCLSIVPEEGAVMNVSELDVHMLDLNSSLHNGISHTMDTDGDGSSKVEEIVPSDSNSNKLIKSSCDSENVSEKRRHESVEECKFEERATFSHSYEMHDNHHMQMDLVTSKVGIFSHSRTTDTMAPFPKLVNFERTHEDIFTFGPDQRGENSFCSPSASPVSPRKLQVLHHGKENILMDHSPEPKRIKMEL